MKSVQDRSERTSSFLVRVWHEPREDGHGPAPLRILLRDLRTGEECYMAEPGQIVEFLARSDAESSVGHRRLDAAAG